MKGIRVKFVSIYSQYALAIIAGIGIAVGVQCATTDQGFSPPYESACVTDLPDPEPPWLPTFGADKGCPEQFRFCLTDEAAIRVVAIIDNYREWVSETWEKCGPPSRRR